MNQFDKSKRLLKKSEFNYVFNQAKKVGTSEFIVLYRDNTLNAARIGLALSKKIIKKAHDRNRIKRLIRETFRTKHIPAVDIVVLGKTGVAKVPNSILIAKLEGLWDKLSVIYKR